MSPISKKRFNAFDDYRQEEISLKAIEMSPDSEKISESDTEEEFHPVERIERLKPTQMMPDRYQPRRLLPTSLRNDFFSRKINCYEAARKWMKLAEGDLAYQAQINQLLAMGASFLEHGQIKPITGNWGTDPNGGYVFYIETGERRFWAACLNFVKENAAEEPQLRIDVVSAPSRFRQVLENRHSETPSAVGQACEISSIILSELNIHPLRDEGDEFKYFRQVHSHRMPRGLWERLIPVMQLSRPRMEQLLGILALPDPLLEAADRNRLPERVLREILTLPESQWAAAVDLCIRENLPSDGLRQRLKEIETKTRTNVDSSPSDTGSNPLSWGRFSRLFSAMSDLNSRDRQQNLEWIAKKVQEEKMTEGVVEFLESLLTVLRHR